MQARGASVAAESGWVLPALLFLLAGWGYLVGLAWRHIRPPFAPPATVVAAVVTVVGALAFAQAAAVALDPARPPQWWRPAIAAIVVAGGAALILSSPRQAALALLPAGALCALSARAAETVGAHLASAVRLPDDLAAGEWSRQAPETRRIVLETWVLAAVAVAFAGQRAATVWGLALVGAGGLALAAGSHLHALRRLSAEEGFLWERADAAAALRWAGLLAAAVLAVALAVPAVPAIVPRGIPDAVRLMLRLLFRHTAPAASRLPTTGARPSFIPGPALPLPSLPTSAPGQGITFGRIFAFDLQGLVILAIAAVLAVVLVVQYLRFVREVGGDWREAFRRLWSAVVSSLAFWRWWRGTRLAFGNRLGPRERPGAARSPAPRAGGEPALGLLDPRRAVRASYRRLLRHVTSAGVVRAPGESPARFEAQLAPHLGGATGDAASLTRAYEEARYSDHPVPRQRVPVVRAALDRVLRAFSLRPRLPPPPDRAKPPPPRG